MDSFESRMTPRFLAESEEMLWEPRVIELGRETVEGFKEDEKGKRRSATNHMNLHTAVTCLFKFADDMTLVGLLW